MLNRRESRAERAGGRLPASRLQKEPVRDRSRWLTLVAITVVSFLLLLEDTAVSVALPSIQRDLGSSLASLEWIVNAYTLALAVLLLPAGRLADSYGQRRIFVLGLAVFSAASLLAGLAPSSWLLIGARTLQGAGAALTASAGLSIISQTFPDDERGTALGLWAGASSVGLALGPVAGAMLTEMFGWPWVFLINVPLGVAACLVASRFIAAPNAVQRRPVPWLTVALWGLALLALLDALTAAGDAGWSSARTVVPAGVSLAWFGLFAVVERSRSVRLLDYAQLRVRQRLGANVVSLLATAIMCNLFVFISLYLQLVLGYGSASAGGMLLPLTLAIVLVSPLAGRASDRVGRRLPAAVGLGLLAGGLLALSWLSEDAQPALLVAGLLVAGIGIGMTTSPATAAALDGDDGVAGEKAGLLNTSRMLGLSLGIATMGAIISGSGDVLAGGAAARVAFVDGLSTALRINAGIGLVAACVAVATLSGAHSRRLGDVTAPARALKRVSP